MDTSDGEKSQNSTKSESEKRLPNHYKVRSIQKTFQAENRGISKNSKLQRVSTFWVGQACAQLQPTL